MGSISSSLNALNTALSTLSKQIQQNQTNRVQVFSAYVQAKRNEKISDAQYIEDLRPNQDRLNVFSTMPSGDKQEYYRFNVNFAGNVHFGMLTDLLNDQGKVLKSKTAKGLDFQILQMHGNTPEVIADSDKTAGQNYTNFKQLQADGLHLNAGKYVVKVSRDATAPDENYFYSFQFAGDRYSQDFDTIQSPAPKSQGEPLLNFLKPDAVTGLLAASIDATSALAGQASVPVNGASLTAGMDSGTNPAVQLLSAFA